MLTLLALCLGLAAIAGAYCVGSSAGYALGVAHGRETEAADHAVAMLDSRFVSAPLSSPGCIINPLPATPRPTLHFGPD